MHAPRKARNLHVPRQPRIARLLRSTTKSSQLQRAHLQPIASSLLDLLATSTCFANLEMLAPLHLARSAAKCSQLQSMPLQPPPLIIASRPARNLHLSRKPRNSRDFHLLRSYTRTASIMFPLSCIVRNESHAQSIDLQITASTQHSNDYFTRLSWTWTTSQYVNEFTK